MISTAPCSARRIPVVEGVGGYVVIGRLRATDREIEHGVSRASSRLTDRAEPPSAGCLLAAGGSADECQEPPLVWSASSAPQTGTRAGRAEQTVAQGAQVTVGRARPTSDAASPT